VTKEILDQWDLKVLLDLQGTKAILELKVQLVHEVILVQLVKLVLLEFLGNLDYLDHLEKLVQEVSKANEDEEVLKDMLEPLECQV
jgi:hypothetical protein